MKQTIRLFVVALLAGAVTLGGYKFFTEEEGVSFIPENNTK